MSSICSPKIGELEVPRGEVLGDWLTNGGDDKKGLCQWGVE